MCDGEYKRSRSNDADSSSSRKRRAGTEEKESSEAQAGLRNDERGIDDKVGESTSSILDSTRVQHFGIFNGKGAKGLPQVEAVMDGDQLTDFGINLIQSLSQAGDLQRKIIHDIVDLRPSQSFDTLSDYIIQRAIKNKIERVVMSKHWDGPSRHIHLIHDCPWNRRECKCFNVPVRGRNNAIHEAETWKESDWLKLLKYLCQNGRWLSYCKVSGKEWLESSKCIGSAGDELYGRYEHLSDEQNSGNTQTRPLEVRYNQFFTCSSRERYSISAMLESERKCDQTHYEPSTTGNKKPSRATPIQIEVFLKRHIVTPAENITKILAWKKNPLFKFILPKDDCFKRAIYAWNNMSLSATYDQLMDMYTNAEEILFKADTVEQYKNMYHTPEKSFEICMNLLAYQLEDVLEQENMKLLEAQMMSIDDVIADFIDDLYLVLERKHWNKKVNTFEIIGPPQSWKTWFTKQIANFYIIVGNIGNCTKGERFPFQDAVNKRVNILNDKAVHPDALQQFLGPLGGDEDNVAQKGVSGEELTRIPVIHTNNIAIFYKDRTLKDAFEQRIIHYEFKRVESDYFRCVGEKICNPLVWPKLIEFSRTTKEKRAQYLQTLENNNLGE